MKYTEEIIRCDVCHKQIKGVYESARWTHIAGNVERDLCLSCNANARTFCVLMGIFMSTTFNDSKNFSEPVEHTMLDPTNFVENYLAKSVIKT